MTQHVNYASTQIAMNLNVKGQEIQHKIGHSQKYIKQKKNKSKDINKYLEHICSTKARMQAFKRRQIAESTNAPNDPNNHRNEG